MNVEGFAEDEYCALREVFEAFLYEGRETGAGLSVWRDGREVVRLWGGWADAARRRSWGSDTLVHTYSVSKPFAALAALLAVKKGALSLDEPVGNYWREYANNGKEQTTLRQILSHQAGQPAFPSSAAEIDLLDDQKLREVLASAAPEYIPGTSLGEHSLTYGHLIDGVLRASTGMSLGQVFAEVRPVLELDAWFGVPAEELYRVAELEYSDPQWPHRTTEDLPPQVKRALTIPAGALDVERLNSTTWRQAVFGAINLHATATAVAKFYSDVASPTGRVRDLLGSELHEQYLGPQVTGHDEIFGTTLTWTLGFIRDTSKIAKGGLGGSASWWSIKHRHACAYLTRRLDDLSRATEIAAVLGDDLTLGEGHWHK